MQEEGLLKSLIYKLALIVPDSLYVRLKYRKNLGKWPNLSYPKTFNEKICWLRLNDHNPHYAKLVDKYEVKKYVADIIGEEHIIPTLGVWERAEDIDFDSLPNQFVMKCNHDSGRIIICKDKDKLDKEWARREMAKSLKRDFYAITREWPYKNVSRKIIAEQYMVDESGKELKDYKFFCFNGRVEFCKVDYGRFKEHHANYYDPVWNLLPFGEVSCSPDFEKKMDCPPNLDKMMEFACRLSKEIPFARIDLYNIKGHSFFGEITFFPAGGMGQFTPIEADEEIGKLLVLPKQIHR